MRNNNFFLKRENCPVCGSRVGEILYSCRFSQYPIKGFLEAFYSGRVEFDYLQGARFELCECFDCGLIWQTQIPNDFLMHKLYEEWISPEETFIAHKKRDNVYHVSHYASEIVSVILYLGSLPSEIDMLDFGMGWGEWCHTAKALGCNAYGTELSRARINYAKEGGIIVIDYDEIEKHEFDFVNVEQVLEHIPSPIGTLEYLRDSLKPNGLVKLSVPNGRNIGRKLRKEENWMAPKGSRNSLNPVSPLEHINCFSHTALVRMAELASLKRVRFPFLQVSTKFPWNTPMRIVKNFAGPFYEDLFGTYAFFRKTE